MHGELLFCRQNVKMSHHDEDDRSKHREAKVFLAFHSSFQMTLKVRGTIQGCWWYVYAWQV